MQSASKSTTWELSQQRTGRFDLQSLMLKEAARAPAERVYWYSLIDLDPAREAIEGFHVDENEYHLGLLTHDLQEKPAWRVMQELMDERVARENAAGAQPGPPAAWRPSCTC